MALYPLLIIVRSRVDFTSSKIYRSSSSMSTPAATTPQDKSREKVNATSPQFPNLPSSPTAPTWVDTLLFWIDWGIKVLGVAAAVVFGIWAPLSYEAANNASASGDSVQSSILSIASVANSQASNAFSVQSSVAARQSAALGNIERRIDAIGQLLLLEFCLGNTVRETCILCGSKINSCYKSRHWGLVSLL